jgi:hypothetical protein
MVPLRVFRPLTPKRFFAPYPVNTAGSEEGFNASLTDDGALDTFAETIIWRLKGTHAMIRYLDKLHLHSD